MASCDAAASDAAAAAAMQKLMHIAADAATGASCGKAQNPKRLLLHCQTQRTQQERQAWTGRWMGRGRKANRNEGSRTKQTMWLQISSKPPTTSSVSPGLGIERALHWQGNHGERGEGREKQRSLLHLGAKNMHPLPRNAHTRLVNKSLSQAGRGKGGRDGWKGWVGCLVGCHRRASEMELQRSLSSDERTSCAELTNRIISCILQTDA